LRSAFFTTEERRALIAAAAAVDVEGIDDEPVLGELGAAVGDGDRRIVLSVPSLVRQLSDAIRERRPVRFGYHGRTRTLHAFAVGRWRTHWYVVGSEDGSDDRRRYRLDRIEPLTDDEVIALGDANGYVIPAGFDAVDAMRLDPNDWGTDPLAVARVRVDADHAHTFQHELGGRVVERTPGSQTFEIDVRHYDSFRDRILGFGTRAVVVSPDALVALVRDHLAAVAQGAS
jgi:predicted DNA-binding transcriptional regulator YafY